MFQKPNRQPKPRSWRNQCIEMLCCLLGLIWVASPNFHSFSHIAELPHKHPDGSSYSHTKAPNQTERFAFRDSLAAAKSVQHASLSRSNELLENSLLTVNSNSGNENGNTESDPISPRREPGDDDAPIFYMLEIEASASESFEVTLTSDLPVYDGHCYESIGFFSVAELGTIGPRGPPLT